MSVMNNDILFIVPSRGRPENVSALIAEWDEVTMFANLLIAVDEDDPFLAEYQAVEKKWSGSNRDWLLPFRYAPRHEMRLSGTLNALAVEYASKYFAIGFMGDDHRPRTVGWDASLLSAMAMLGTGMAYGDDELQGRALPTAIAMTSDMIEAMGYMVPPGCIHLFFDNMWLWLGRELGRITYCEQVIIEHLHPIAGKSDVDDGYVENNSTTMYAHDEAAYKRWLAEDAMNALDAIRSVMV